jgi:hypothetical protein
MADTGNRRDDWRTNRPASTGRPAGKGKTGRRVALAAVVVALLVGLVLSLPVFVNKTREPVCFAVPVVEYHKLRDSRWPPNPWAESDAHGLRDRFTGDSAQAFQHQEKATFLRELANAVKRADDENRPLVVYYTALGTVANDTPYLLPADARPHDPSSWLTLDEVLDPLKRGTTPRLLVLDIRPVRSSRAAMPTGDVNELLDAKLCSADLPLLVLTANTPAAGPLNLPTVRHTAFGLALERGALGAADGWLPNERPNQELTARELCLYTRECTHSASGGTQRPQLHGSGPDFLLLTLPPERVLPPEPSLLAYPKFLADAWADIDKARGVGLPGRAPRAFRQQTDAAVDADAGWLAGTSEQTLKDRFEGTFAAFRTELAVKTLAPPEVVVSSVARWRLKTPGTEAQLKAAAEGLQPVLGLLKSDTFAELRTTDKAKATEKFDVELGKVKLADTVPFEAVVAVLWATAVDSPQVWVAKDLLAVADKLPLPKKQATVELAALQLLATIPESRNAKARTEAAAAWLDATAAAEAVVLFDARVLPVVKVRLQMAEKLYREEAIAMVDPDTPRVRFARIGENLRTVQVEYGSIRDDAAVATEAWRRVQDVRAALADLSGRYPHEFTRPATGRECSLTELTDALITVEGHLRSDTPPDFARLKLDSAKLQSRHLAVVGALKLPAVGQKVLESALNWPGWTAAERKRIADGVQDTAGEVLARWPTTSSGREPAAPKQVGREVYAESVRDLRNRSDLIRLWDEPRAKQIRAELTSDTPPADRFTRLAADVSVELRIEPKKRFDASEAERPFIGWAVWADDVPALPVGDPSRTNPEVVLARDAETRFGRWLAGERYARLNKELQRLDDPPEPGGSRGERFERAAKRYRAVADLFP